MSDAPSNPKKAFVKEKHEKMDTLKKEIKTLEQNLDTLREGTSKKSVSDGEVKNLTSDGESKRLAYKLISEKRAEYKTVRKSHFTPPV